MFCPRCGKEIPPESKEIDESKEILFECSLPQDIFESYNGKYVWISYGITAGLIKRYKGKYSLTSLGRVVYGSLMTISNALDHQPKLVSEISRSPR